MFAVIRTGVNQYRVAADDTWQVEKLEGSAGDRIVFPDVLMLGGDNIQVGAPTISGAMVAGEVLQHTRGEKVIAFKKRRRKNSRRKRGHRQDLTVVRITGINADGSARAEAASEPAAPASA